jgi:hypothetical protein
MSSVTTRYSLLIMKRAKHLSCRHITGYPVAEKWLKDRKGRRLTYDILTHYRRVIAALADGEARTSPPRTTL